MIHQERNICLEKRPLFGKSKAEGDLFLRLENLQSEIRTLSTGIEEYKEFLKSLQRR